MSLRDRNAALSATAIHRKPACRHAKGCARGRRQEDPSMGDQKKLKSEGSDRREPTAGHAPRETG